MPLKRSVPTGVRAASTSVALGPGPNQRALKLRVLQIGTRTPESVSAPPSGS